MPDVVIGAIVGGMAAIVSAAITKLGDEIASRSKVEREAKRDLFKELLGQRRDLYARFIARTTAAQVDSFSSAGRGGVNSDILRDILDILDLIQITSSKAVRHEASALFNLLSLPGFDHARINQQRQSLIEEIRNERRLDEF